MDRGITDGVIQAVMIALFAAAAMMWDAFQMRIPNWLNVTGAAAGLIYHLFESKLEGLVYAASGMAGLLAAALLLYVMGAIGAGDVKWFAALGAMAGLIFSIHVLLTSILVAGLLGLILAVSGKRRLKQQFPFMYAVFPAVWMTYFILYGQGGA